MVLASVWIIGTGTDKVVQDSEPVQGMSGTLLNLGVRDRDGQVSCPDRDQPSHARLWGPSPGDFRAVALPVPVWRQGLHVMAQGTESHSETHSPNAVLQVDLAGAPD